MNDTTISKTLSYYLRHGANTKGVKIDPDGYVNLADLLTQKEFYGVTTADIRRVVANCAKQRFELEGCKIRARQGHSITSVVDAGLTPITMTDVSSNEFAIHGTYMEILHKIVASPGLSRMQRQHIHMTTPDIVFTTQNKKGQSGVRYDTDLFLWINMKKVLALGLLLYRSSNGVILCPGDADGFIPWSCIERCTDRQQRPIHF